MYNHLLYFCYWLINAAVLYVFALLFQGNVVLGNWRFSPVESAIYAGFWVTFFIWVLWDFAIAKGVKFDSSAVTLGYFWIGNAFSLWIVARFSQYAGLGVSSYFWVLVVGLVAYILQRLVRRMVVGKKSA